MKYFVLISKVSIIILIAIIYLLKISGNVSVKDFNDIMYILDAGWTEE